MVMPMSSSQDNSMFPAYDFDYAAYQDQCLQDYGVRPRPRWITTEFGGHVSQFCNLMISCKSRFSAQTWLQIISTFTEIVMVVVKSRKGKL